MVALLALGADVLVALIAELHAGTIWDVYALSAPVASSTTVAVPPVLPTLVAGKSFRDAHLCTGLAPLENILALFEDLPILVVGEEDDAGAWLRADNVL